MELTLSFFHQQSTDRAISPNFTVSINTLTRKHLFHLIVTSLMPLCLSLLIYKMGVLFFFELNETEHMTHPGCYFVDLRGKLHFFFFSRESWNWVFFSNNLDRQCPFPQSLLSVDKYTLKDIIRFTSYTSLLPLCLSFLICKMGILTTPYS